MTSIRESSILLPISLFILVQLKFRAEDGLVHAYIPTISEMQFYTF